MRMSSKKKDSNLPGQITFDLLTMNPPVQRVSEEMDRVNISSTIQDNIVISQIRKQSPAFANVIPEEHYQRAKDLLGEIYHITSGILVNRLRISANLAFVIMDRLKSEGLITEDGRKNTEKGKKCGFDKKINGGE